METAGRSVKPVPVVLFPGKLPECRTQTNMAATGNHVHAATENDHEEHNVPGNCSPRDRDLEC